MRSPTLVTMTERVLYLHGFASGPGSKKARFFRERFAAAGISVDVPDLVPGAFEDITVSGQFRVIDQAIAGRPVTLIGSSMGGYLAALYAARHPEVERVILLAPAFDFAARWVERVGSAGMARWRETGVLPVFHYGLNREALVRYSLMEDAQRYESFPDVRQPVLIVHGIHDDVVPSRLSEQFAQNRPNVQLQPADSDHELMNVLDLLWEKTRKFCEIDSPA
jgi:uncharacterized protein